MRTPVTKRGQTVVPAAIRTHHQIAQRDRLVRLDDGAVLRVVPISGDPSEALPGRGKGDGLIEHLSAERARDRGHGS